MTIRINGQRTAQDPSATDGQAQTRGPTGTSAGLRKLGALGLSALSQERNGESAPAGAAGLPRVAIHMLSGLIGKASGAPPPSDAALGAALDVGRAAASVFGKAAQARSDRKAEVRSAEAQHKKESAAAQLNVAEDRLAKAHQSRVRTKAEAPGTSRPQTWSAKLKSKFYDFRANVGLDHRTKDDFKQLVKDGNTSKQAFKLSQEKLRALDASEAADLAAARAQGETKAGRQQSGAMSQDEAVAWATSNSKRSNSDPAN